jgi:hypothetical protein
MKFLAVASFVFVIILGLFLSQDASAQQMHHFPIMGKCALGFVPLGEVCVLNDRCGPSTYPGKACAKDYPLTVAGIELKSDIEKSR